MSARTVVRFRDVPWRHCLRKRFHSYPRLLQSPQGGKIPNYFSNFDIETAAGELAKVMTNKDIPSNPSALDFLDKAQFELATPLVSQANTNVEKFVAASPTPAGYNSKIYSIANQLAKDGKHPTPEQLSDLFRLMSWDSPLGELKDEALAIWREMRSRGVIPTDKGYVALLNVSSV